MNGFHNSEADPNPDPTPTGGAADQSARALAVCTWPRDLRDLRDWAHLDYLINTLSQLQANTHSPFLLYNNQCSMASEINTESSFSTEPDNLTALHKESGLLTTHYSCRTESNFLIGASRLLNCVPLPARKQPHRSWIWLHGHSLGQYDNNKKLVKKWLCKICYNREPAPILSTYLLSTMKNTTKIIDHL